ncbi:MAG: tetratricopeptide repeat protein, partial [Anaerolineae bacterium]
YRTALADVAVRSLGAGLPVEVDTRAMALGVSRDDMIKTGAVVADGPRLAFLEPLLAHHCAASSLAGRLAANPRQLAEALGDLRDPTTADTLVHVYIMSPSPAAFAAALMSLDGGPEVAARCIAEPHAADPAGAAGPEAVVRDLVALSPPAPVASLFRLGEALARHGQERAAEAALRSALDRTDGEVDLDEIFERPDVDAPPPVSEWLREFVKKRNRGLAMRGLKDREAQGALHQAARALGRLDADLTFERGLAAAEAGDVDRAIAAFQGAVAAEPDRVRYQYHLGLSLVAAGRVDEAVAHLTKAQDQAPSNPRVAAAMADALKARDELDAARSAMRTARRLDPAEPAFEQAEGELSAELGDLEAAAARMGAAVAARPDRPSWHDALGQVQAERGDWAAAVEAFRAAHGLAPQEPLFLRHLGRALLEASDPLGAVEVLGQAHRLAARDAGIASDLARALAVVGEAAQALEVLEAALAADDLWPADHLLMARLLRQSGDLGRSLTHARRAVELAPASDRAASELR